jgi:hypothetical protein
VKQRQPEEANMATYSNRNDGGSIPDLVLTRIEGDWLGSNIGRSVWFKWRGTKQSCFMAVEDGYWLITETTYTDEFQEWLDEYLDEYDSLEYMFDVGNLIPASYDITFEEDN